MPVTDSPYTDSEFIKNLYADPQNEVLLAEYILATGNDAASGIGFSGGSALLVAQAAGATGGGYQGGGYCFTGETLAWMADGRCLSLAYLWFNRNEFNGQYIKAFGAGNTIVDGEIESIFRVRSNAMMQTRFTDESEPMRMIKEHRFWTPDGFVPMYQLENGSKVYTYDTEWSMAEIESMALIDLPEGEWFYNMHIKHYTTYFASSVGGKPKAVSNAKAPAPEIP